MDPRRVRGQHRAESPGGGCEADHMIVALSESVIQRVEAQAPGQTVERFAHVGHRGFDLFHVAPAKSLGKTGRRGLRGDECLRGLAGVPDGQFVFHKVFRRRFEKVEDLRHAQRLEGAPVVPAQVARN